METRCCHHGCENSCQYYCSCHWVTGVSLFVRRPEFPRPGKLRSIESIVKVLADRSVCDRSAIEDRLLRIQEDATTAVRCFGLTHSLTEVLTPFDSLFSLCTLDVLSTVVFRFATSGYRWSRLRYHTYIPPVYKCVIVRPTSSPPLLQPCWSHHVCLLLRRSLRCWSPFLQLHTYVLQPFV